MHQRHSSRVLLWILLLPLYAATQTPATRWYKGNIHTHSLWSDGNQFPEMIMDWYKTRGYHFIALSDHNILAAGEKWATVPAHPFRQKSFRDYLEKFGKEWVVSQIDSAGQIRVRLKTLAEYRPLFEQKDSFLIMQAEEISDLYKDKPIHLGAINIRELVHPQGGGSVAEVMQKNLDAVYAQRARTGATMFAHINHPNFRWAIKVEDMMQLKGERFFEVYNGHPHVHNYGDSTTIGMEELWDRLQIHYIREGRELLYGLATDDAHDFLEYKTGISNPGRGWIMVRSEALTPDALIHAMEQGRFYATTGVQLKDMQFSKGRLHVQVQPEAGVRYRIQFWGAGTTAGSKHKGILLEEVEGTEARYRLRRKNLYVRAKVISSKPKENPYATGDMETAWTQPVRNRRFKD